MGKYPPVFLLCVADALVSSVSANTQPAMEQADELKRRGQTEGFFASIRTYAAAHTIVSDLKRDLELALKACQAIARVDVETKLDDDTTLRSVYGEALFQMGVIEVFEGRLSDAIQWFRDSAKYGGEQGAYYNIGLCYLSLGRPQEAVDAFEKCIGLGPLTSLAISAGMELARIGQLQLQ